MNQQPSEVRVQEVTNQIINTYTECRMQIFQNNARTVSSLYSNEYSRRYTGVSSSIGNKLFAIMNTLYLVCCCTIYSLHSCEIVVLDMFKFSNLT